MVKLGIIWALCLTINTFNCSGVPALDDDNQESRILEKVILSSPTLSAIGVLMEKVNHQWSANHLLSHVTNHSVLVATKYSSVLQFSVDILIVLSGKRHKPANLFRFIKNQFVIVLLVVDEKIPEEEVLKAYDRQNVLNTYLIQVEKPLTISTFNRFTGKVEKVNEENLQDIFYDKICSIERGFRVNVTNVETPPYSVIKNDKVLGRDGKLIDLLCEKLHLDCVITVDNPLKMQRMMVPIYKMWARLSEFSTNDEIMLPHQNGTEMFQWATPVLMHRVCAVVPKSPRYSSLSNLAQTFDLISWILFSLIFFLLIQFFHVIVFRRRFGFFHITFRVIEMHLLSASDFLVKNTSQRPFSYLYCCILIVYCFAITVFFECNLISFLLTPNYYDNLNTIEEVIRSNKTLFVPYFIAYELALELSKMEHGSVRKYNGTVMELMQLLQENQRAGFIALDDHIDTIMVSPLNLGKEDGPHYHVVKECFFDAFTSNYMQYFSPFERRINEIKIRIRENGLWDQWKRTDDLTMNKYTFDAGPKNSLNFFDFFYIFYMAFFGWALCIVAFVGELVYYWIDLRKTKRVPQNNKTRISYV